jgi:hypothetical protein
VAKFKNWLDPFFTKEAKKSENKKPLVWKVE